MSLFVNLFRDQRKGSFLLDSKAKGKDRENIKEKFVRAILFSFSDCKYSLFPRLFIIITGPSTMLLGHSTGQVRLLDFYYSTDELGLVVQSCPQRVCNWSGCSTSQVLHCKLQWS